MLRLQKEYKEAGGKNLWANYQDNAKVFEEKELQEAFHKYCLRVKSKRTRRGADPACDLGEYINEDLLDRVGMNFFNSGMSGRLRALESLVRFLGCPWGLVHSAGTISLRSPTTWVLCFRV